MDELTNRTPTPFSDGHALNSEGLWQYIQSMSPETVAQLSKPVSPETFRVMERNIVGMLGTLPSEHFNLTITTSREHLGQLLASAMMSGYFLRNVEQRMHFEQALTASESDVEFTN